jgi:ABC-type Zn uptake system ZnuABC Zn-binding protein ZnuA
VGGDPHSYEPSLGDRALLDRADLVVANGLGLEESLVDVLETAAGDGTALIEMGRLVDTIGYASDDAADHDEADHDDADHDHDHGHGVDPHVWFDPSRVAGALPALGAELVDRAGLDPAAVEGCVATYGRQLEELDGDIKELVAGLPVDDRKLVTNHQTLGYFADRYGFEVVGTVLPSPSGLAEPNPAQLRALAERIDGEGVAAVFAETQHSTEGADALADSLAGVGVVTLTTDTLGEAGSPTDSYVGLVRTTAGDVVAALG